MLAFILSGATVVGSLSVEPAFAQADGVTITAGQAIAVQANLSVAISAVYNQGLSGPALTAALQDAIIQTMTGAIAAMGPAAAGSIVSAMLAAPALSNIPPALIGAAFGRAAAQVAATYGTAAALAVAVTIANEGPAGSQSAFASAEVAAGGPVSVADAGTSSPSASGSGSAGGFSQAGSSGSTSSSGGSSSGCGNPSCS